MRGPITGRRADLAILDDPIKSQFEIDSARSREFLWSWYRSDLTTRLKPRGRVVIVMTRWHEDDLAGRLLTHGASEWRLLRLPALAEAGDPLLRVPGEPLWPDWEDAVALQRKRTAVGERVWSALFQQSPRPPYGSLFKADRIGVVDVPLSGALGRTVRAWDFAATSEAEGGDPDWTVGLKLARYKSDCWVVLDITKFRGSPLAVCDTLLSVAKADGSAVMISLPEDPGQAGKFQAREYIRRLAGYQVRASRESGSKIIRATPVAAQVEAGNILMARGAWNHVFVEELREFPHGRKDDQVDALSRAFMVLTEGAVPVRRAAVSLIGR
ncbi:MAG: phage terminase large subunit [Acetobacteraceae bacterium]